MKLKWISIFVLSSILLFSCSSTSSIQSSGKASASSSTSVVREVEAVNKLQSGIQIIFKSLGDGLSIKPGDEVFFHYVGRLLNGQIFDNSYDRYKPLSIKSGYGMVIKGLEEAIQILRKGDKALITIPPELAYGSKDLGIIPPQSSLIFEIEIVDVRPLKAYTYEPVSGDTLKTSSGLRYIVLKEGKGNLVKPAQKVVVNYAGFLWDGTKFDSSFDRGLPFGFQAGTGEVIAAWDEAIQLMNKGGKIRILVPPHLGYGEKGSPPEIPKNARLIFDIELLEISN